MSSTLDRLAELEITLPPPVAPVAMYVPALRAGDQVYVSGQVPVSDGTVLATGRLGAEISVEHGAQLARQCALNVLAAVHDHVGLDQLKRVIKVVGFVASAPGFTEQSAVVNGASQLFVELLGDAGRHARSAVGVAALPLGVPVEVEAIVELL